MAGLNNPSVNKLPRVVTSVMVNSRIFGEITWSLTFKFPILLTLINCQRCLKSKNEKTFTIVSRFSNYFVTNHTCTQCDLYVTAIYFKHLSTEYDYDTDRTGFQLF